MKGETSETTTGSDRPEPGGGADVKVEQGAGEEDVEAAVGRTNHGSDKHCWPFVT